MYVSCTTYAKSDPKDTEIKRCKSAIGYKICTMLSAYLHCILHMCQVCGKEQLNSNYKFHRALLEREVFGDSTEHSCILSIFIVSSDAQNTSWTTRQTGTKLKAVWQPGNLNVFLPFTFVGTEVQQIHRAWVESYNNSWIFLLEKEI